MNRLIIYFFLFFSCVLSAQNGKIPKDFKEFSKSPSNGEAFQRIIFDFDDDNINDFVTVIYNRSYDDLRSNKKYLLIYLSTLKKNILVDFDIFNATYFTAPKLRNKTISFQMYEEGTGLWGHNIKLRFDKKAKKIQLIGYDFSYRTPGGHCNKSYNLLTGDFSVVNDFYDMKSKKTRVEKFAGSKRQSKSIYTNDFNVNFFKNLSEIGSKFERE